MTMQKTAKTLVKKAMKKVPERVKRNAYIAFSTVLILTLLFVLNARFYGWHEALPSLVPITIVVAVVCALGMHLTYTPPRRTNQNGA